MISQSVPTFFNPHNKKNVFRSHKAFALLAFVLLASCATQKPTYYWGHYEPLIYDMYHKPGKAEPGVQIDKLTQDIQRAQDNGLKVPPGLHAHLGLMYAIQGNVAQSQAAFLKEKTLYPESAVMIDGMLKRANERHKQGVQP